MSGAAPGPVTGLAVLALVGELVLLGALALAGARLGSVPLAVALPVGSTLVWGRWLAPRAPRRLQHPGRLGLELVLVVVAAGLLARSGARGAALVVLVAVGLVLTLAEVREGRRSRVA